tara:strand:+ start:280 stop:558 length:279 start_codon:yes stop_codon:yes gene_type:complete
MPDITFSITDTQKKALDTVISGGVAGIGTWAENFTSVRAAKAQTLIVNELVKHCNDNGIALGVGVTAQVDQAYSIGVAHTAGRVIAPLDNLG